MKEGTTHKQVVGEKKTMLFSALEWKIALV